MSESYDELIDPPQQPPDLGDVVRNVMTAQYFGAAGADAAGFEAYFDTIMTEVDKVEPHARRAAKDCKLADERTWWTPLQKALFGALAQFFERENPNATLRELRADAFARTIADAVTSGVEQRALHQATLRPLSDHEKAVREAEERDREFERNRRRRPKIKAIYPV